MPSVTFLLDIDPQTGLTRSKRKGNNDLRYENMHISFHRKVRSSFLKIAKINKSRIKIIDAGQDKNKISEITNLFKNISIKILSPQNFNLNFEPNEIGSSFAQNAKIKSDAKRSASKKTAVLSLMMISIHLRCWPIFLRLYDILMGWILERRNAINKIKRRVIIFMTGL